MREEKIHFQSGKWEMEGLYQTDHTKRGVVITHPHPLYGGDMFNPVVEAISAAYQKSGYTTLRFNFRGAGKSTGTHDHGIGEQADLASAIDFMESKGLQEVHLSGYSFGAWVNAMALQGVLAVQEMTMVAPPVAFIDFEKGIRLPMLSAVVAGSLDEIAPPNLIHPLMGRWNPDAHIDIVDGADHFFFGFLDEVTRKLAQRIQRCD